MQRSTTQLRIAVLLVGLVFLAAQFHLCTELTSAGGVSHFCPYCATAGAAIASSAPTLGLAPANLLLDFSPAQVVASTDVPFSIAPRAPPWL